MGDQTVGLDHDLTKGTKGERFLADIDLVGQMFA